MPRTSGNFWKEAVVLPTYLLQALFVLTGLMLLYELYMILPHARHPALRAMLHGVAGIVSLLCGNTLGGAFGAGIGLNILTLPTAFLLGPPGTALLWAVRYLL